MIGVGFSLTGTLVGDRGIDERAFAFVLSEIAGEVGRPMDAVALGAAARAFAVRVANEPAARDELLRRAVIDVLGIDAPVRVIAGRLRSSVAEVLSECTDVPPETPATLARIAELNIPYAVLSNGWSAVEARRAAMIGVSGPVILGEDDGCVKPEPAAFERLAHALRLPPEQIFFVGDDAQLDIIPAIELGFRAVWLNRDKRPFPHASLTPEYTIANLADLLVPLAEAYSRAALGLRYILHSSLGWRNGYFVPGVEFGLNDPESLRFKPS